MKRRTLLVGSSALALACNARSQSSSRLRRIGFMRWSPPSPNVQDNFRRALAAFGYAEGRSIHINWRWVASADQADRSAVELVQEGVELIVVNDTPVAHAAARATRSVPIVLAGIADPVGSGLVTGLARPGGNITGLSWNLPAIVGKELELLKEVLPTATRFAFLGSAQDPATPLFVQNTLHAAKHLGVHVMPVRVTGPAEFTAAFDEMLRERVQGLVVQPLFTPQSPAVAELALQHRLVSISAFRFFVESGGTLSYGPSGSARWQRVAEYADRILRGAKPGDLPIEEPRVFDMAINLKTVRALGITVPRSLLLRADEVIQ